MVRLLFSIGVLGLFLSGCAGQRLNSLCFECTKMNQSWKSFSFEKLEGTWKGTLNTLSDSLAATDERHTEEKIEVSFLGGRKLLKVYKIPSCGLFPEESMVFLYELWGKEGKKLSNRKSFEVFGRRKDGGVSHGRVHITQKENINLCEYTQIKDEITMNRMGLPSIDYSKRLTPDGRVLASGNTKEVYIHFDFLNFRHAKGRQNPQWQKEDKTYPPLLFRFAKSPYTVKTPFERGEWISKTESVFRLWPLP